MKKRLHELSVLANGARANGVEPPETLDREAKELHAALAALAKKKGSGK